MIGLGLTSAGQAAFHRLLGMSHDIQAIVHILDLNHNRKSDVTRMVLDGSVTIDWGAEVTRSASVTFFDPRHDMGLDADSPANGALFLDRMLAIYYRVQTPDNLTTYTIPVFTGPIIKVDRDWASVVVEAQGKELLSQHQSWWAGTYKIGAYKTSVITDLMRRYTGETRFNLAPSTARLTANLAISTNSKPWDVAKSLAASMSCYLFYDARGTLVMRRWNSAPLFIFHDKGGGTILSKPKIGYDLSNTVNSVILTGGVPKGMTKPIVVRRYAASTHPLSPYKLGRNGIPRYLWEAMQNDTIKTVSAANTAADQRIARGLIETVNVSFDCLPIPHLEPNDAVLIRTEEWQTTAYTRQMTIPLTASGQASFGYLRTPNPTSKSVRKH